MAGTLSQKLIPRLVARFGKLGVRINDDKQPVATFPAAHADVGDLSIYDDDVELLVDVGDLTHGHFLPRLHEAPQEEREEELVERVMHSSTRFSTIRLSFGHQTLQVAGTPVGRSADRLERAQIYMVRSTKCGVAEIV